jgi:hypothetical protein
VLANGMAIVKPTTLAATPIVVQTDDRVSPLT